MNPDPDVDEAREDASLLNRTLIQEWCKNKDIFTRIFAVKSPEELLLWRDTTFSLRKRF